MTRHYSCSALALLCTALAACGASTTVASDGSATEAMAQDSSPDLGLPDLGLPDLGLPDLGLPDLGLPDLGLPELPPPPPPPPPVDVPGTTDVVLPSNLPLGGACERDEQCQSRICVRSEGLVGGCRAPCRRDEDCMPMGGTVNCAVDRAPSGARTVCTEVRGSGGVGADPCMTDHQCFSDVCAANLCQNACATDADCAAGWRCGNYPVGVGGVARLCRVNTITGVTVEDYTLSEDNTFVDRGTRPQIAVVPADAVSVTFSTHDLGGSELYALVSDVDAPDMTPLVDLRTASNVREQPVRENFYRHQYNSVTVPSNDVLRLMRGGIYQATFSLLNDRAAMTTVATRRMRTSVRIKRAPGGALGLDWTLHLRVFFVGLASGPTAATAAMNTRLRAAIASMTALYASASVRVVVDGYADVTGASATRLATIDSRQELQELFATGSASSRGEVLNLFLVRAIASTAGLENAIGVAGDINGPSGVHGTLSSGVVASWDATLGRTDLLPLVIAHECGHYLGLWHTRERLEPCTSPTDTMCSPWNGVDAIADTPNDAASSPRYLMHWQAGGSVISPGQSVVMRLHGLVH